MGNVCEKTSGRQQDVGRPQPLGHLGPGEAQWQQRSAPPPWAGGPSSQGWQGQQPQMFQGGPPPNMWQGHGGPQPQMWQGQPQAQQWQTYSSQGGQGHPQGGPNPTTQNMSPEEFQRLFGAFDGLFQNVNINAHGGQPNVKINGATQFSQTTVIGPDGKPQVYTSGDPSAAAAFNFDKFFSHFDQAFDPGASGGAPQASRGSTAPRASATASQVDSPIMAIPVAFSFASKEAVERLGKTDVKVAALENAVSAVEQRWQNGEVEVSEATTLLAHIESRVKRIEGDEIDDVQTGGISTHAFHTLC